MATAIGDLVVHLGMDSSRFTRGTKGVKSSLANLRGYAVTAGLAIGAALAAGAIASIKAASDMEETMNKFNVVFGINSRVVKAWADGYASEVGRSQKQIADFMASSQDLFVPMGFDKKSAMAMSKTVTGLAVDLASFNNVSDSVTFRDLQAALTGSGETMKKYGVIVDEATVKQEMLNMGLSKEEFTNVAKAQARLNIIMRGTTAAQGDAVRSSGSFANQMKALKAATSDTAAAIGKEFLPVVTPMVGGLTSLIKAVGSRFTNTVNGTTVPALETLGNSIDKISVKTNKARKEYERFKVSLEWQAQGAFGDPALDMAKGYRKVADEQKAIALGMKPWQAAIADIEQRTRNTGAIMDPYKKALADAAREAERWTNAASATTWMDDVRDKMFQMSTGVDDFAASFSAIASAPGVTPEQLERMKKMYTQFRALEKTQALKEFGKGITESVKTPLENAREELVKLDTLRRMGERMGGISEDTYRRRVGQLGAEVLPGSRGTRYSGAMEKGSSEAYSTILNAGKSSDKIAREQLKAGKMTVEELREIKTRIGKPEVVSIPS